MLAGFVLLVAGLLGAGPVPVVVVLLVTVIIPVIASWVLYRRLEGGSESSGNDSLRP